MKRRCPLTVRFGKDIAGLIQLFEWQSKMSNVNDQYKQVIERNVETGGCARRMKDFLFGFNFRDQTFDPDRNFVFNVKMLAFCGRLPKHYWSIKELY